MRTSTWKPGRNYEQRTPDKANVLVFESWRAHLSYYPLYLFIAVHENDGDVINEKGEVEHLF